MDLWLFYDHFNLVIYAVSWWLSFYRKRFMQMAHGCITLFVRSFEYCLYHMCFHFEINQSCHCTNANDNESISFIFLVICSVL